MSLSITALTPGQLPSLANPGSRSVGMAPPAAALANASFEVSIKSRNEPMALLMKASVTGINEAFKPDSGENTIQGMGGQSSSGGGMAERIMSLVTQLFEAFKKQHAGEDEGATLKDFMSTVRGGFEQGFNEATDILKAMGVMTDEMAADMTKVFEFVQQGFADFETAQVNRTASTATSVAVSG